jgi:hypothetical protein
MMTGMDVAPSEWQKHIRRFDGRRRHALVAASRGLLRTLLQALGLASLSEEEAAARLLAVAARTAPDYVPRVPDDDHLPYELLFPSDPA